MKYFLPAMIWAVLIFVFSTKVGVQLPKTSIIAPDKLGHFAAYGLFCWLALFGFYRNQRLTNWSAAASIFIVTSYGVGMEFIQWAFFPNRFFEVWDMVANFIGSMLGYLVFKVPPKKST